jgi:predicted short-subunit dehydrogenase-like oxidoreductase (DUF2520 family)
VGKVGGAIGVALAGASYEITAAWSRSRAGRQRVHGLLDVPVLSPEATAAAAEVVFLTVPDDAIAEMAERIAPHVGAGKFVVHTSGGTSIEALAPVREAGARIGSVHPLQTIPDARKGAEALAGAAVAITAADADRPPLARLARAWGGRPFDLPDEAKGVYHAAAVFASNYLVSAVWAASTLLESIGVGNPRQHLAPLVRTSVDNVLARGGQRALTGPVARGDAELVRRHVEALRDGDPTEHAITDAYRYLAKMTASLAGADAETFRKATA